MNTGKRPRFHLENEEDRRRKKYEESIQIKKNCLHQEFEKMEEIHRVDELSVKSQNEIKFRNEYNVVQNFRKKKAADLTGLKQLYAELEQEMIERESADAAAAAAAAGNFDGSMFASQTLDSKQLGGVLSLQQQQQNFSMIFSKSYYRPLSVGFLANSRQSNRGDLHQYLAHLQSRLKDMDTNIENEEDHNQRVKNQIINIQQTILLLQDQITELHFMQNVSDNRFSSLQAIKFNAHKKKQLAVRNLQAAKQDVTDLQAMEEEFIQRKKEHQKHEKKLIKDGEEMTTHIMLSIEEKTQENEKMLQKIRHEQQKMRKKLQDLSQSKYTVMNIQCFETYEKIFMGSQVDVQQIDELYNTQQSSGPDYQHLIFTKSQLFPNENTIYTNSSVQHQQKQQQLSPQPSHSRQSSSNQVPPITSSRNKHGSQETFVDSQENNLHKRQPSSCSQLSGQMNSIQQSQEPMHHQRGYLKESIASSIGQNHNNPNYILQEGVEIENEQERHQIQQVINNFNESHKEGSCNKIAEHMFVTYKDLVHTSQVNSLTYQELLKSKTLLKNVLEDVTSELKQLKQLNQHIAEMDQNPQKELKAYDRFDSLDAGLILISPYINTNLSTEENSKDKQQTKTITVAKQNQVVEEVATINILCQNETDKQSDKILKLIEQNEHFIFNFFLNYSESIVRMCQTILNVCDLSIQLVPPQIENMCLDIISYLQSIWLQKARKMSLQPIKGTGSIFANLPGAGGTGLLGINSGNQQISSRKKSTMLLQQSNLQHCDTSNLQLASTSQGQGDDALIDQQQQHMQTQPDSAGTQSNQLSPTIQVGINLVQSSSNSPQIMPSSVSPNNRSSINLNDQQQQQKSQQVTKLQKEKLTQADFIHMFMEIFQGSTREQALKVYNFIKINRLIVFFCTEDNIRQFFIRKKRASQNQEDAIEKVVLDLKQLENEGREIFLKKLKVIMDNQVSVIKKVSQQIEEVLPGIQSKKPEFNPKKAIKPKYIRPTDYIKDAQKMVAKNIINYKDNQDDETYDDRVVFFQDQDNLVKNITEKEKMTNLIAYIKSTQLNKGEKTPRQQLNSTNTGGQVASQQSGQQGLNSIQQQQNQQQSGDVGGGGQIGGSGSNGQQGSSSGQQQSNATLQQQTAQGGQSQGQQQQQQQQQPGQTQQQQSQQQAQVVLTPQQQWQQEQDSFVAKQGQQIKNFYLTEKKNRQIQQQKSLEFRPQQQCNVQGLCVRLQEVPERARTLKNFSQSQIILSKIERFDKLSDPVSFQTLEKVRGTKKQTHIELKSELDNLTEHYLKPGTAYATRRALALEQRRVCEQNSLQQNHFFLQSEQGTRAQKHIQQSERQLRLQTDQSLNINSNKNNGSVHNNNKRSGFNSSNGFNYKIVTQEELQQQQQQDSLQDSSSNQQQVSNQKSIKTATLSNTYATSSGKRRQIDSAKMNDSRLTTQISNNTRIMHQMQQQSIENQKFYSKYVQSQSSSGQGDIFSILQSENAGRFGNNHEVSKGVKKQQGKIKKFTQQNSVQNFNSKADFNSFPFFSNLGPNPYSSLQADHLNKPQPILINKDFKFQSQLQEDDEIYGSNNNKNNIQ